MRLPLIICVCIIALFSLMLFIAPYAAQKNVMYKYQVADHNKFKLLVVWNQGLGERELMARYVHAAKKLDIEFRCVSATIKNNKYESMIGNLPKAAIATMRPDVVVVQESNLELFTNSPIFRVLDTNENLFFIRKNNDEWDFKDDCLAKYTGYLVPFNNINIVGQACKTRNKKFVGMRWFPTVHKVSYPPPQPRKLFYNGGSGILRNSEKYKQLFTKLATTDYLYLINDLVYAELMPIKDNTFKQHFIDDRQWKKDIGTTEELIPFDGVSLLNVHNKAGVSLLLHSEAHLPYGSPTGRIFEAAAANSVIISDKNQFIIEHFGDNVLYINVEQDADEIFAQIDAHMQWIFTHTAEAQAKAQRCHDIFLEKFTLEDQICRMMELHKEITADYKNAVPARGL